MAGGNPFINQQGGSSGKTSAFKKVVDGLQIVVIIAAILVLVYLFFIIPSQVDGSSMFPNLVNDEILLTNRLIQIVGGPDHFFPDYNYKRGDIVVFRKESMDSDLVKRVIGLPGERIKLESGQFFVNGQPLEEKYIDTANYPTNPDTFLQEGVEKEIPDNHYFLVGDNRPGSKDSRNADVGFVARSEIRGKPFVRVFPLDKFTILRRGEFSLG